ncbi:MAG: hypothetical protein IKW77_11865 [Salinivirgaceae bacterium]|nr:hypothetical protein [Salinivirgaceae bacterium]
MSTDKANRNDAKIQTLLEKLKSTEPELCSEIESYIAKETSLRHDAEAKLAACQEQQKQDEQSLNLLKDEFNKHLQRFELIAESVAIANTEESCPHAINMVLDRIGFHMSPKRILVFIDTPDSTMCKVEYQWVAKDVQPFSHNTAINYKECPLWQKMQAEHKMVPGSQLNDLPDDITLILENIGLKNVYMFPLTGNDGTSFGSIMFETGENRQLSKLEIRYIQIVTIVLSGIIHIYRILNDLILEKERAQEADRLKSSFLVNMSHDIRIPLNSIIGFSDLLADEDLTQTDREEFIDLINKSGQDLITLIDNIIDISKIETGQMTVKKEECPIFPLLNDIMAVFKNDRKLEERDDLSLQLDLPPQYAQIKFSTDIFKFRQIYTNLIDNAIKFSNTGCIKFGVSKVLDNTIEFYVQDTGIGISEDQQHIIFQLFGKVDRTYTNEYTGTGLGLPICKSLVEMLGGQIYVVSALGKGSTFYFTHPLPEGVSDSLTNTRDVKSPFNWKDRRIVILDNAETDRKYLTHVLSNTGIEIMWMDTPDKAVKFFESNKLADAMLIEMSPANIEAAERIHKISPVPIVAQSSDNQSDDDRQLAMKSGCTEYIVKPLSTTKLLTTIDNLFVKK